MVFVSMSLCGSIVVWRYSTFERVFVNSVEFVLTDLQFFQS